MFTGESAAASADPFRHRHWLPYRGNPWWRIHLPYRDVRTMLPSRRLNKTARTYFAIVTAAAAAVVAFRIPSKSFNIII